MNFRISRCAAKIDRVCIDRVREERKQQVDGQVVAPPSETGSLNMTVSCDEVVSCCCCGCSCCELVRRGTKQLVQHVDSLKALALVRDEIWSILNDVNIRASNGGLMTGVDTCSLCLFVF